MTLITTTEELAAACRRMARHPFVTVDTEFLRETTFWPKLCVLQVASDEEAVVVDALAPDIDLIPFLDLMADTGVVKVFHAARQDLEIVWKMSGRLPDPLFDTQVAAMVCGFGDQVSYSELAQTLCRATIDKSSRFTDWARRPLTAAQITYALADVTHLRDIYRALVRQLESSKRTGWLADEMRTLLSPATYEQRPDQAWERFRSKLRRPRDVAVMMELAAWRETEAQARDVPRSRILKDDALVELAQVAPRSLDALADLRAVPRGMEKSRLGPDVLAAVERGLARDPVSTPRPDRDRRGGGGGATVELLKVLLRQVAEAHGVAAKLIATVDDLEAIAASDDAPVPALEGWRRTMFGAKAIDLKNGRLALTIEGGRVVPLEWQDGDRPEG